MNWEEKFKEYEKQAEETPVNNFKEHIYGCFVAISEIKPAEPFVPTPSEFPEDVISDYKEKYRKIDLVYKLEKLRNPKKKVDTESVLKYMNNSTKKGLICRYLKLKKDRKAVL